VVASFLEARLLCVSPAYLLEWLCDPQQPLDEHYLFGTTPSEQVAALEEGRAGGGRPPQQQASQSL
jgi:hypothetical protein